MQFYTKFSLIDIPFNTKFTFQVFLTFNYQFYSLCLESANVTNYSIHGLTKTSYVWWNIYTKRGTFCGDNYFCCQILLLKLMPYFYCSFPQDHSTLIIYSTVQIYPCSSQQLAVPSIRGTKNFVYRHWLTKTKTNNCGLDVLPPYS